MKNNSIRTGFCFFIMLCSSCNKQLNLLPTDSIPPAKAFTSIADLQEGLEGVYELNAGALNRVFIGSILADEVKVGAGNRGEGILSFTWQYTSNDAGTELEFLSDFQAYYTMIDAINVELASIGNVPSENAGDSTQKKRIQAELISLRGIAHYEVLIRFMSIGYDPNSLGVPIILQSDLLGQPARATVAGVITQVSADLAAGMAEPAIPDAPDDVTSLSHATIAAYQARVALLTRSWASVVTYAAQALRLSGKVLADSSNFAGYWYDSSEVETLWKYRNQAMPQLYWMDAAEDLYFEPSDKLKNLFDRSGNDIRFNTYFKLNATPDDSIIINKYPGSPNGLQVNDVKLVRVAELYLDMAEAYTGMANLSAATDTLNALRKTRIKNYTDITTFGSQQIALQAISDERFKELCFEGFRFFDLKRDSLPVNRLATDVQSTNWLNLPVADHHFALPIPEHEILANKNMVQNPGY